MSKEEVRLGALWMESKQFSSFQMSENVYRILVMCEGGMGFVILCGRPSIIRRVMLLVKLCDDYFELV